MLVDARKTGSERRVRPNGERRLFVQTRSRTSFSDSTAARAFEADPSVEVVAVQAETGDADAAATPGPVDIAVFHRTAPSQLPALPSLFLAPPEALAAGGLSPAEAAPLSQRRIDRVAAEHPILDGVSLLGLPARIPIREVDPRCKPLATAGNLPAVVACDPADLLAAPASATPNPPPDLTARSVVIAFDLDLSPLSQRPDLAALLQNATEWLAGTLTDGDDTILPGLQDERATRINDSDLDPVAPGRLAELTQDTRRPWSWRTLALAGLLLASIEAITFFRGITV